MKIIYIANIRLPTEKAHGLAIMKMCEAFVSRGCSLTLIIPTRKNDIKENPFDYYSIKPSFEIKKIKCPDTIRFVFFGFLLQNLFFSVLSFFAVRGKDFDLIYSRDELPIFLLGLSGVKNIIWEQHAQKKGFTIKLLLRFIGNIVVISNGLAEELKNIGYKGRVLIAPSGVDVGDFKEVDSSKKQLRLDLGLPLDRLIVGYIGKYRSMGEEKGVKGIIEAVADAHKKKSEVFLLLVGIDGEDRATVSDACIGLGLNDGDYCIVGHVHYKEMIKYNKSCDALVMNYPTTVHYSKYMSPLKLFEYMASGVPIITVKIPTVCSILNESNAVLVRPDNKESLAGGILAVVGNKDLATKISIQALKDVQFYSWRNRSGRILDFVRTF